MTSYQTSLSVTFNRCVFTWRTWSPTKFHPDPIWNDGALGPNTERTTTRWLAIWVFLILNKKAVLSQRRPRDAPYISLPRKFCTVPDYAHAPLSPKFLTAFCSEWACDCSGQIWSSYSSKRSWDNWEHRINFGSSCIRPRSVFSMIFNRLLFAFGLRRAKVFG